MFALSRTRVHEEPNMIRIICGPGPTIHASISLPLRTLHDSPTLDSTPALTSISADPDAISLANSYLTYSALLTTSKPTT